MLTAECPPLQPPSAALVLGCPLPGDGALRGWCISQGHLKSLSGATLFCSSLLFPTLVGLGWVSGCHPTPVLLPGKPHGWRSLVSCSPWDCQELDTTERLHLHFSLSCFGEGNGNPLQCSCLENPRDGGAWWAAIYGVAQSRTQLK